MYYIWDNVYSTWIDDYFEKYEQAESEKKMLIEERKAQGLPYDYDIFQKLT